MTSAIWALVTNVFAPEITYESPSRTACVRIAKTSDPASGSEAALAPMKRPSHSPGSHVARCSSVPNVRVGIEFVQRCAFSENRSLWSLVP